MAVWKQFNKNVHKHQFRAPLSGAVSVLESTYVANLKLSQGVFFSSFGFVGI